MRRHHHLFGFSFWFFFLLTTIFLSGCAGSSLFTSYPRQMADIRPLLDSPAPQQALPRLSAGLNGNDALLYAQEAGRSAQIAGDFQHSKRLFNQAIADYQHEDDRAYISLSALGANSGAVLLNDNAIPYHGNPFERIMLHQYQALNYLFDKDMPGALVEVRRAGELQALTAERYANSQPAQDINNGQVNAQLARLTEASDERNNLLNAYSYTLTGLIYALANQPNDAFIDYRKAIRLSPDNAFLQRALLQLAQQLGMPEYRQWQSLWPTAANYLQHQPPRHKNGHLIMLYEQGFIPAKQAFTVPFRVDNYWQSIALPTYATPLTPAPLPQVSGLPQPLVLAPLVDLAPLAITALREQLPAIWLRQASRAYAKTQINQQSARQTDLLAVASQIANLVSEQADRRSWLSLPRQVGIAEQSLPPGQYQVQFSRQQAQTITVSPGKTTLVWAMNTGNYTHFYSIII